MHDTAGAPSRAGRHGYPRFHQILVSLLLAGECARKLGPIRECKCLQGASEANISILLRPFGHTQE